MAVLLLHFKRCSLQQYFICMVSYYKSLVLVYARYFACKYHTFFITLKALEFICQNKNLIVGRETFNKLPGVHIYEYVFASDKTLSGV